MVAHPNFIDWLNRNERSSEDFNTFSKPFYGCIIYCFKDKEVT